MNNEIGNKAIKNVYSAGLFYVAKIILQFWVRLVFIRTLSIEYLGLNGLFSSIIDILALSESGIGVAVVYSLYKPLIDKDYCKVNELMKLLKKAYHWIGIGILIIGVFPAFNLNFFINDIPDIQGIELLYYLFVIDTGISYFWSYKRSLLIADQKQYIVNLFQGYSQIGLTILQIISLLVWQNYFVFLLIKIIDTIVENYLISIQVDKVYPYLDLNNKISLDSSVKEEIKQNVKGMIFHKVGGLIAANLVTVLMSKYLGLIVVGIYSNYYMVLRAFEGIIYQLFNAVTASIGHFNISNTDDEKKNLFTITQFIVATLAFLVCSMLFIFFNPLISLWVGSEYCFESITVALLVINFYIVFVRKTVLLYKDALGLFWNDRYKPLAEIISNLCLGIFLGNIFGLNGILASLIITNIFIPLWFEPFIVFRNGLDYSFRYYMKDLILYSFLTLLFSYTIRYLFDVWEITIVSWIQFGLAIFIVGIILIAIWSAIFGFTRNGQIVARLIKSKVQKLGG